MNESLPQFAHSMVRRSMRFSLCIALSGVLCLLGAGTAWGQNVPDGLFARGLDLDGVDDYVEVADATSLNTYATTNEITLEYWLYPRGSTEQNLIAKRDASNVGGFLQTTLNASAIVRSYVHMPTSTGSNNGMWPYVDISYTANQWVHLAMTYSDATGLRVYKDGVLANTLAVTGALNSVASPMRFGANTLSLNAFSDAIIDEVRLWSVARTEAEIRDAMNHVLVGDETGLDGYWRLDEGAGTAAYDQTANANDGTLTNMDAVNDWVLADHTPYEIVAYGPTPHVGVLPGADADGDALTYSIVTDGTGGTATVTDAATGAFTYQATSAVSGTDSFVYRISDGTNTVNDTVDVKLKLFSVTGQAADAGSGRGTAWGDYDGDGDLDLYVANDNSANVLYRNDAGTFTATGQAADAGSGRGTAWGDYDGDGDLDLYVANDNSANVLYRNNAASFNWLAVDLASLVSAPDGNGARLVSAGERHSEAGRKPVMQGGGRLIDRPKCSRPPSSMIDPICSSDAPCG